MAKWKLKWIKLEGLKDIEEGKKDAPGRVGPQGLVRGYMQFPFGCWSKAHRRRILRNATEDFQTQIL